jgi:hypothetical protein
MLLLDRLRRSVPLALAATVAAGALVVAGAATAAASGPATTETGRGRLTFGVQPASAAKPDGRAAYRYSVTPGGRLTDHVAVRNFSAAPLVVSVYVTDALNVEGDGFGLLPAATKPVDVGTWFGVERSRGATRLTVPAKGTTILPLALTVPLDAQPGDHTGGVVVSVTTVTKNAQGTDTRLEQRVGARVFIRVSGPTRPDLTVQDLTAHYDGSWWNPFSPGRTVVTYRVRNSGNIDLGARSTVEVSGPLGLLARTSRPADSRLLLPRGDVQVTTTVPGTWPLFRLTSKVTVDPLVQVGDPVTGLRAVHAAVTIWAVPWAAIGLVVLLLIVVVLLVVRRRRARRPSGGDGRAVGASSGPTKPPAAAGAHRGAAARVVGLVAVPAVVAITALPAAAAPPVPYTDSSAAGGITLCDGSGHQITSGSLADHPMANLAVGAAAPPQGYAAAGRTAGLFAFQPRQGVDPGSWSGLILGSLSRYSSTDHPMSELLPRDTSIGEFVAAYPAQWDGLVQLRLLLRAPGVPTSVAGYSATTLRVSGGRWQQIGPDAGALCRSGRAESVVRLLGLPTTRPSARPTAGAAGATPSPSDTSQPISTGAATATSAATTPGSAAVAPGTSPTSGAQAAAAADHAAPPTGRTGRGLPGWVGPVGAVAVLAALLGLLLRADRRRRMS